MLSKRRMEVYELLYDDGPMTGNEVIRRMMILHPGTNQGGFNTRLSELEKQGVIEQVGYRIDPVSGHNNILWDVTPDLPVALEKRVSKNDKVSEIKKMLSALGRTLPDEYKPAARNIYRKVADL